MGFFLTPPVHATSFLAMLAVGPVFSGAMAATGGAGGRAASWTKGKIVGLIVAALFAAGLIAVIVVGVRDPDAFKAKSKDATTTTTSGTTKTLQDNTKVETAAPIAKAPIKTTPAASATTTKPGATTTPAAKPATPAAPVQNSAFDKVGALLGGGVPSQDTKLATFMASMGKAQVNVQESAKQALAATPYSAACTPANGPDLLKAINVQRCTYITLGRNVTYLMPKGSIMEITNTVVIVGDPTMRPIINAAKAQRAFHVHEDGYLQVSFVEIYRGNEYTNGDFIYTRGGSMLADPGAGATFIGVVFGQPAASMTAADVREQLVLGGHLLVLGGEVFITGCTFLNVNPLATRFPVFMGGDELVLNGYVYETATTHTQFSGIIIGAGSGVFVSIINGMGVYTGVIFTRAVVAASAGGYGLQAGIIGGIGVFTGCTITSNIALLSFYGAGAQQFLGGGVLVNTGVESIGAFGAGFPVGLAPFVTVGGGIFISTGATYNVNAGVQMISVTGGLTFLGGGVTNAVGTNFVRSLGLAGAYGLAGQHFQGGGTTQFIGGGNTLQTGVAGGWFLGGQNYMGGGNMIEVMQPSSRNHPVVYRQGQGNHAWMGGGMYVCTMSPDDAQSPKRTTYKPKWQKRWWISNYGNTNGPTGDVEDVKMYWKWGQIPYTRRWLGAAEDTKVYDANVFHEKARKLSEMSAKAEAFLTRQGQHLMGARTTVCIDSKVTGNDEDCDQGVLGMDLVTNTTSCNINFERPQCPAGSPMVDSTDPSAKVCKQTNARCQAQQGANKRHERKLRELEAGDHATYITRANVVVACKSEAECVKSDVLKAVVGKFIMEKGDIHPTEHGLKFAAAKADVDKLFKDLYSAATTNGDSGIPSCPVAKEFTIFAVSDEQAEHKLVGELMRTLNDDPNNSDLMSAIKKVAPGVCVFMSDVNLATVIPSVKAGSFNKGEANNQGKTAVGPAVSIKDKDGKFVDDVIAGGEYTAVISNFQPGTVLNGFWMNGDDAAAAPTPLFSDKVAPGPYGASLEHKFVAPPEFEGLHASILVQSKLFKAVSASSGMLTYLD